MFGAVPLAGQGSSTKIHELKEPHQLVLTRVFHAAGSRWPASSRLALRQMTGASSIPGQDRPRTSSLATSLGGHQPTSSLSSALSTMRAIPSRPPPSDVPLSSTYDPRHTNVWAQSEKHISAAPRSAKKHLAFEADRPVLSAAPSDDLDFSSGAHGAGTDNDRTAGLPASRVAADVPMVDFPPSDPAPPGSIPTHPQTESTLMAASASSGTAPCTQRQPLHSGSPNVLLAARVSARP